MLVLVALLLASRSFRKQKASAEAAGRQSDLGNPQPDNLRPIADMRIDQ